MNNLDIIKARMEALGWMYAYACNAPDKGEDIRQTEVPELLEAFHKDIDAQPEDSPNNLTAPTSYKREASFFFCIRR